MIQVTFKDAAKNKKIAPLLARYAAHYAAKYANNMNPNVATAYAVEDMWNMFKSGPSVDYIVATMIDDLEYIGA